MSARSEFNKRMQKMQESAKKSVPQNSTEALIDKLEEDAAAKSRHTVKTVKTAKKASAAPENASGPVVRSRTITQPLGRPKKYEGVQEIITIKVPKEIKDKVRTAASANRMSLVEYMMYIVENDYREHQDEYEA